MDQSGNTSFIPKRTDADAPMRQRGSSMSGLVFLSTVIFFIAIAAFVAVFLWRATVQKNIAALGNQISAVESQVDLGNVQKLETLDAQLKAASAVVANHDLITPVFQLIQTTTLPSIQYTKFNFSISQKTGDVIVDLAGRSLGGYTPIGQQSLIFSKNPQIIDNEFSNLSLDNTGGIDFNLELTIDPKSLSYTNIVAAEAVSDIASDSTTVPSGVLVNQPQAN